MFGKNSPDRKAKEEKRDLLNQIALQNEELKKIILNINQEHEKEIFQMKNSLQTIISQKTRNYQKEISDITENNMLVPLKILEKNKYLDEIISYALGNTPSEDFTNFCNLMYLINQKSYSILRDFIPLIPERTLFAINGPEKSEIKNSILDIENIPNVLSNFYPDINKKIHVTLGGDAASIKLIAESGKTAAYVFKILPLDKNLKPIPIYICQTKNGTSNKEILKICENIIFQIEKSGKFIVDFVATDGDAAFDKKHNKAFEIIEINLNEDINFIEKLKKLSEYKHFPVSDFLHLLKNARSHLLNHLLMVDPESLKIINMSLFQKVTNITNAIDDRSSIASMKDSYAMEIFSWGTFEKLIANKQYESAFYVLPFCYMIQAVNSPSLNRDERLELFETAIKYFYFQLKNVRKSLPTSFFTSSYSSESLGTLFGEEIFIKRCINTCFALSLAMFKTQNISFSRVGTHNIENFFGKIKLLSHFNYSYDNFLRAVINTILVNRICFNLNYKIKIRERINEAGAYVKEDTLLSKNHGEFNFEIIFVNLFNILKGEESCSQKMNELIKEYSLFISFPNNAIKFDKQTVFSGTLSHFQFATNNYAKNITSQSHSKSPIDFYLKKNKKNKSNKKSMLNWLYDVLETILKIQISGETVKYSDIISFDAKSDYKISEKLFINWFNSMTMHLHIQLDENDPSSIDNINLNKLVKEFIDIRSTKYKKSIINYIKEKLEDDLNIILKIVRNNYQFCIIDALSNIEQKDESNVIDNDITDNLYDFSNSVDEVMSN